MMQWLLLSVVALVAVLVLFYVVCRWRKSEACAMLSLRQRLEKQEEELRRVRDAEDARNLFLASLSHELRTPLSGITGAIRLLRATGLNTRQQEYARMAAHASTTVLEIVDDMLTFSRIQAGKEEVENTAFSIRALIDDMLSLQTMKARARNIALVRDVSSDVPDRLLGDCGKLKQILLNLLGNAIKFTDEGSVTVTVEVVSEEMREGHGGYRSTPLGQGKPGSVRLCFAVSDTGIGIGADSLDKVFQPFVQLDDSARAGRGGTGLGLAICQRLVHAMGGGVRLESVPGAGTTARFELAFQLAPAPRPGHLEKPPVSRAGRERPSLTVLVVEDDEINRLVCTRYLALSGHHPLAAAEARQVFQLVEHTPSVPDAILLDMHLAGRSGMDLLVQLHEAYPHWEEVPVVAMSADVSGAARQQAQAGGVEVFLPKPFSAAQLEAALQAVVKHGAVRLPGPPAAEGALDESFLREERANLGQEVMLELLNIFRAGAATRLAAMNDAVRRRDWQTVRDQAHAVQGSAANLGLKRVLLQARALREAAAAEGACLPDEIQACVDDLELAIHRGADALRAFLLAAAQEDIALATHGDN